MLSKSKFQFDRIIICTLFYSYTYFLFALTLLVAQDNDRCVFECLDYSDTHWLIERVR